MGGDPRGLPRGALAQLGVGDARVVLRRAVHGLAPWFVLGPLVAREQYGDIGVYGLVSAALGLGTIAGSLLGIGWRPRFPMRAAMLAILLWPAAAILYAAGVTLLVVVPAIVDRRCRHRAVRRVVD